jgi:hypothetical protein
MDIKNLHVKDSIKGLIPLSTIGLKPNGNFKKGYSILMYCDGSIPLFDFEHKLPIAVFRHDNLITEDQYPKYANEYSLDKFTAMIGEPYDMDLLPILIDRLVSD